MNSILNFHILISIIFCFTAGENFLPIVLKSKIRSQHRSNKSEGKLWMAYLEKRLEIMKFSFEKIELSSSLLGIYKTILRSKLFDDILTNCNKMMPKKLMNSKSIYMGTYVVHKWEEKYRTGPETFASICHSAAICIKGKYILKILGISWLIFFD